MSGIFLHSDVIFPITNLHHFTIVSSEMYCCLLQPVPQTLKRELKAASNTMKPHAQFSTIEVVKLRYTQKNPVLYALGSFTCLAATYFPRGSRPKYHRRWRA
jgi:hypothetical protein